MLFFKNYSISFSDTSMQQPGYPQTDPTLLYPPPVSPEPVSSLTHLGKLLVGHDVPRTGGWDR